MDNNAIGNIIEIPDKFTIIVDVRDIFISVGDKIVIYEPGPKILHPQTNEELGQYDFIKDIVEVIDTNESFSVCKKIVRKSGSKFSMSVTPLLQQQTYETEEELMVNQNEIKNWKIKNPVISIGDPVKNLNNWLFPIF